MDMCAETVAEPKPIDDYFWELEGHYKRIVIIEHP